MKKKHIRIIIITLGLILMCLTVAHAQEDSKDVTEIIKSLPYSIALGNSCDNEFGENPNYQICHSDGMEMNGWNFAVLWMQLTISSPITDFGVEQDLEVLIKNGRIHKLCPEEEYDSPSTIIILNTSLSIQEPELDVFKVFPNPAKNKVTIKGKNIRSVWCYDLNGRLMFSIENPSEINEVYLLGYSTGMYSLFIENNLGNVQTKKLIIK